MSIFNLFALCGGLAFFLFGMKIMSTGLEKMAGSRLESTLKKMTSSPLRSMVLGAGITVAIQSSSALTVMLVGLVNSGIMELGQTVSVIMGSNIGTTLTAWLLSLTGIESDNFFIRMLKPTSFAPIVAIIGFVMSLSKREKRRDTGSIMLGFALLMYGMSEMSGSVSGLADMPEFTRVLTLFDNPLMGVLVGAVVTGVIQASAASVGMLQALAMTGSISTGMAIPIIMGQNIGTCVTAMLSSMGASRNAKRVAAVHVWFNILGTAIFLSIFTLYTKFVNPAFADRAITPMGIAVAHSAFNVLATLVLFPFGKLLEKLAIITVRGKKVTEEVLIDDRLLITPAVAISECRAVMVKMAAKAEETLLLAISLLHDFTPEGAEKVAAAENEIDMYEDKLGAFLIKLSTKELTSENSAEIAKLLHIIGDIERIGDHALNLAETARELADKGAEFSPAAKSDLSVIESALTEILTMTVQALTEGDRELARKVEPLEDVIDQLTFDIKARHISRLQSGDCTILLGFILSDILTNMERVSDHCSNIAVCMRQSNDEGVSAHGYLSQLKEQTTGEFAEELREYTAKYELQEPQTVEEPQLTVEDADYIRHNM
ncbi:MAG: Na/Pi cotransporter family protein [Ruminococcaceae bacterium]|nr:Na/Pi cotransporter family protein [Oscillospiraceae bacterium]